MSDRYQTLIHTPVGQLLARNLGLPNPVTLDRWVEGAPLVDGTVLVCGEGRLAGPVVAALDRLGVAAVRDLDEAAGGSDDSAVGGAPEADGDGGTVRLRGVVVDATGLTDSADLAELPRLLTPLMRRMRSCSRILVLGTPPEQAHGAERVAQRALEGFTRSLAKEVRRGGTAQLVHVAEGAEDALDSTLAFLLSPKSAYVSGQVVRVGTGGVRHAAEQPADPQRPLTGKVALVTGASRGIGEQIARVLHRDGAHVLGVDVPQAADDLQRLTNELGGDQLLLDITGPDAPKRIAQHVQREHGGVDVVVHNAGITRDKKLANMKPERFAAVVTVNLTAPERITTELLRQGLVRPNGRIIGVASTSGIAGNLGQTNYAASKAGVIGFVEGLAGDLPDQITANAVAPGFIETKMTAAVPFATRELGRRLNSLSQGGQPVDVAEAVAWYAHPGSTAVNGTVLRVCGQMMMGA